MWVPVLPLELLPQEVFLASAERMFGPSLLRAGSLYVTGPPIFSPEASGYSRTKVRGCPMIPMCTRLRIVPYTAAIEVLS